MYTPAALLVPALAAAAVLAAPAPLAEPDTLSVPLSHLQSRQYSDDPDVRRAWMQGQAAGLRSKYKMLLNDNDLELLKRDREIAAAQARKRQQTSGTASLTDLNVDASYAAKVAVGTPAQYFDVIMDTGSSDLWIMDSDCQQCVGITTFDIKTSSSLQVSAEPFAVSYGSGDVAGLLASETVSLAGFTVNNQGFGLVNQTVAQEAGETLIDPPLSGLMGLAFASIANSGATPWWQSLADHVWTDKQFGVFLKRYRGDMTVQAIEEDGGEILFGGVNPSLYTGEINYIDIPAANEDYWRIPIDAISIGGKDLGYRTSRASAAIDTGTTLIGAPANVVQAIYAQIPGSSSLKSQGMDGYFQYPCQYSVSMTMTFGGIQYFISDNDFNLGTAFRGSSMCVGAVFTVQTSSRSPIDWIVGASFLKNVYSTYRYSPTAIGFAQLAENVQNGGSSSIAVSNTNGSGIIPGVGSGGLGSSAARNSVSAAAVAAGVIAAIAL